MARLAATLMMMTLAGVMLLVPGAAAAHAAATELTAAAAPGPTPPAWTWQQQDQRAPGLGLQAIMRGVAAAKREVKAALADPPAAFERYLQAFAAEAAHAGHVVPGGLGDSRSRAERMQVFVDNLRAADAYNSNASNALVARGITHFAHLTQQEFAQAYLGSQNFSASATLPAAGPLGGGAAAGMDGVAGETVLDDGGWEVEMAAEATAAASGSSSSPAARRMLGVRATFVASDISGLGGEAELTTQAPAPAAAAAAGVLPPAAATQQPRCSGLRANPYNDGPEQLPARVDWVSAGGTTRIKDQGSCGSCVAFASTALAEFMHMRKFGTTNTTTDLSEQDLLECTAGNGCQGQHQELYPDLLACVGVALEADEPYRAANEADSCQRVQRHSGMSVAGGGGWAYVMADTDSLARALNHAPVMLSMDASAWQLYRGGVLGCDARAGGPGGVNHAVVLVGYYDGVHLEDGQAWDVFIVRNSWGTWWGSGNSGGNLAGHLLVRKDCPARATTADDLGIVPVFG